jgi:biotin carboxylase
MKSILMISGGIEAIPGIIKAKEMGLNVVVSDGSPHAPGFSYSDDKIIASTYDYKDTFLKANKYHSQKNPFDGVLSIASDVPYTVAYIANKLNLPGIDLESAKLSTDKILMKKAFRDKKIPIPDFKEIKSFSELECIINEWGYPLIIKPVDSRGSRGVLKLNYGIDIKWAWNYSNKNSPSSRVMVEKYLDGMQLSTESIIINSKCYACGYSDRNYEFMDLYAPHIIENGSDMPSILSNDKKQIIDKIIQKGAEALGVKNGIIKGDIVLNDGEIKIIELATRLSGGYFSTNMIPLSTGIDIVKQSIKMAIGDPIDINDLLPKDNKYICQRYYMVGNNHSINHEMKTKINNMDGIEFSDYSNIEENQGFPENSNGWIAMVISSGESKKIAQENAINALKIIGEKK